MLQSEWRNTILYINFFSIHNTTNGDFSTNILILLHRRSNQRVFSSANYSWIFLIFHISLIATVPLVRTRFHNVCKWYGLFSALRLPIFLTHMHTQTQPNKQTRIHTCTQANPSSIYLFSSHSIIANRSHL